MMADKPLKICEKGGGYGKTDDADRKELWQ